MVYLDGSYLWNDYMYTMHLKQNTAQKVLLSARFHDSQNYVGCKFTQDSVSVVNVRDKLRTEFDSAGLQNTASNFTDGNIGIAVKGTKVGCYWDNKLVVWSDIPDGPPYGGVGLRVEDPNVNVSSVSFDSVQVHPL
ncbi:hypothetical protein KW787_03540 [Candidatus Pacearchaeota archaeon]|nr:hypothetical protein [Candidatus Pacearchaeota archaeon]